MASLVSRDDVQTAGHAKLNAVNKRISKSDPGEIEVGVSIEEASHFVL